MRTGERERGGERVHTVLSRSTANQLNTAVWNEWRKNKVQLQANYILRNLILP
jgi:hypothetical protein